MSGTFVTVYTSEPDTMKMKNYNIQRRGVLIMKCIGIIGAMEQEVAKIKEKMQDVTITSRARMDFYEGTLEGKKVVVVRSGIGKVNAGMCHTDPCRCIWCGSGDQYRNCRKSE